ncbi:hypothetical protein TNCV_4017001 [Trichonephila clavipes]|nr:hypothetical protein TNCV_4017001 [Trichonephila clavipes]
MWDSGLLSFLQKLLDSTSKTLVFFHEIRYKAHPSKSKLGVLAHSLFPFLHDEMSFSWRAMPRIYGCRLAAQIVCVYDCL